MDLFQIIFICAGSIVFIALVVIAVIQRLRRRKKPDLPQPACPICGKTVKNGMYHMPRIAVMPKEKTLGSIKVVFARTIEESELKACAQCVETAWAESKLKFQGLFVSMARQKESLFKELVDFQNELYTPIKDRRKTNDPKIN